jgi:hypothetical protein
LQEHAPHAQALLHVCVPLPSQPWVALGAQTPWAPHEDQADHVPSPLHVRVSVPQFPHDCDAAPLQGHTPPVQVTPVAQALPHAPQLLLSVCSSTQVLPHSE